MSARSLTREEAGRRWRAGFLDWAVNNAIEECLIADAHCNGPVVKAHSIQAGLLSQIAVNGHVYMFRIRTDEAQALTRFGLRQATTYTGFCAAHDASLFRPIDFDESRPYDPSSDEQALLLALRAISKEYWAKSNVLEFLRRLTSLSRTGQIEEFMQLTKLDDEVARWLMTHGEGLFSSSLMGTKSGNDRLKKTFLSLLTQVRQKRFHLWKTRAYKIPQRVTMAVASAFTPEFDLEGKRIGSLDLHFDVAELILNVIPVNGDTWVTFTFNRRFLDRFSGFFRQLDRCTEAEFRIAISKMIPIHSENAAFSPTLIEKLPGSRKKEIEGLFSNTLHGAKPYGETTEVDLFAI